MKTSKSHPYTISVDFDGVIHSYTSPWVNARTIPDPPVPGALAWLVEISRDFDVAIFTTRNHQWGGRRAVKRWLREQLTEFFWPVYNRCGDNWTHADVDDAAAFGAETLLKTWTFPSHKPPALVYVDDRAWRFTGDNFPTRDEIHLARPWNKPAKAS